MFTGIVQEIGEVTASEKKGGNLRLTVAAEKCSGQLSPGSSIAVNGACLTAVESGGGKFRMDVVEETLVKTALGDQVRRKFVNLELPLRADGRLDGHIVLGHVDTVGSVLKIQKRDESWWYSIRIPGEFMKFVVHTGSIAVDGVSLTVAEINDDICRFSIIPHTITHTIFQYYRDTDRVNIETDVVGKYVEKQLANARPFRPGAPPITLARLKEEGF
ncbi:MAG TPA: riboflavin synthase [Geobacteraceae bacterium]|nr:riboflavin synthase [Geobacteraceae bacterium]